jgi:glucoamylase
VLLIRIFAGLLIGTILTAASARAGEAGGGPGLPSQYQSGGKDAFGTAFGDTSRVWFTVTLGAVSEVFYDRISNPMLRGIEFAVTDGATFTDFESRDMTHNVSLPDSKALVVEVVSTAPSHGYTLRKRIFTDPNGQALMVSVRFETDRDDLSLYILADPMGNGTGDDDAGSVENGVFVLHDTDCFVIEVDDGLAEATVGFRGVNDGYTQLDRDWTLNEQHATARGGNVVFAGRVMITGPVTEFSVIAGFGPTDVEARAAAWSVRRRGVEEIEKQFDGGWNTYCASIVPAPDTHDALYYSSAMILRACEDKSHPGAFIASPSMGWGDIGGPWGDFRGDKNDQYYFKVWPRDLYHTASALLALGDTAAALRALEFLDDRAQLPDGSFPQNTDVTGRAFWPTIQMDQVACPILLAHRLYRVGALSPDRHWNSLIRPAAEYIVEHGPFTRHERWENREGYSPASIAAQIAALFTAADFAAANGDETVAFRYREIAERWERSVDRWTYTFRGNRFSSPGHYVRISKNEWPNETLINNEDLDVSFLELVRLGVRRPDDPLIRNTLHACDAQLRRDVRGHEGWLRFTGDDYGESKRGRIWPLLSGERGHAAIAAGGSAATHIGAMRAFSNGIVLSEQVWDEGEASGHSTGSCAPLAWAHSEYVKLVLSERAGRIVDMPASMAARLESAPLALTHLFPDTLAPHPDGDTMTMTFRVVTDRPAESLQVWLDRTPAPSRWEDDRFTVELFGVGVDSVLLVFDTSPRLLYEGRPIAEAQKASERKSIRFLALAGSFNGWNPMDTGTVMMRGGDGVYRTTLRLPAGIHEFKYAANGHWEINFGGEGARIWQDGPNFRVEASEAGDYLFSIAVDGGGMDAKPSPAGQDAASQGGGGSQSVTRVQ